MASDSNAQNAQNVQPVQIAPPIQLDMNLITAIAIAVKQAMGDNAQLNMQELGDTIGAAVAGGIAKNTRRKVSFGEYIAKKMAGRSILKRPAWQNDAFVAADVLSNKEIDLLNQITHSGRYIDRKVEVIVGMEDGNESVYVRFKNATPDDRFDGQRYWPGGKWVDGTHKTGFEHMLEQIVEAQAEERKEREELEQEVQQRRRGFGHSKAYQAAKQATA